MPLFGPPNVENLKKKKDVSGLIKALTYQKDARIRHDAATALGQMGAKTALEPLIAALKDPDAEVRVGASWALGKIPDKNTIEALIAALQDPAQVVRQNAAFALKTIGDQRAIEPLITALNDEFEIVQNIACAALQEMRSERAVAPLIAILQNAASEVRKSAAIALGGIGNKQALEPLIAALKDPDANVRIGATWAFGKMPDSQAVEALLVCLQDSVQGVRQNAAYALKTVGDERTVEPLITALNDEFEMVRQNAAAALAQMPDKRAVVPLALTATNDSLDQVRKVASEALRTICSTYDMSELIAECKTRDGFTSPSRDQVDTALGDGEMGELPLTVLSVIQGSDVTESILSVVYNGQEITSRKPEHLSYDAWQRRKEIAQKQIESASRILEEMARWSPESVAQNLSHSSEKIRQLVVEILERSNWQPGKDEAGARYMVIKSRWDDCVEIGAPAVQPLIDALQPLDRWKTRDETRSHSIIKAMGEIGDPRALEPLVERMKRHDQYLSHGIYGHWAEPETMIEIIRALAAIGGPEIVMPLIEVLEYATGEVRQAAAKVLVKTYQSSQLDDEQKQAILAQRPTIINPRVEKRTHHDIHEDGPAYCAGEHHDVTNSSVTHADQGIGVDFPL